jgi:hypothetical protein
LYTCYLTKKEKSTLSFSVLPADLSVQEPVTWTYNVVDYTLSLKFNSAVLDYEQGSNKTFSVVANGYTTNQEFKINVFME